MLDLSKTSAAQKEKLKASYGKHFKVFLLHTLYMQSPKSSIELTRNNAIKALVENLNGGVFDPRLLNSLGTALAYQKYTEVLEQADIKSWVVEVCNTLGLSVCGADDTNKYLPENRFLLAQLTPQHLDSYYISVFEKALDSSQYGMILLNNPESFPWNPKKVELLKNLLLNSSHAHQSGVWPLLGLMNKADPNLQFNSDFGVSIINEEEWVDSSKFAKKTNVNTGGGIGGFFKNIFGGSGSGSVAQSKDVILSAAGTKLEAQNLFDVVEILERYMKNKRLSLDKEFNAAVSEIVAQLTSINKSLGDRSVQRENPEFFYDTRRLVVDDLPKILEEYIKTPPEHKKTVDETSGKTYKELALQNVENILEYVSSLNTALGQQNFKAQKTYDVYLKEKLNKVRSNANLEVSKVESGPTSEKDGLLIDLDMPGTKPTLKM